MTHASQAGEERFSQRLYEMIRNHGMPWGSPEYGQRMSAVQVPGLGSALVVAHPERNGQESKLVFIFISERDPTKPATFQDLGPNGTIDAIDLGPHVVVSSQEVKAAYPEIVACIEHIGTTGTMYEKPDVFLALLGVKKH